MRGVQAVTIAGCIALCGPALADKRPEAIHVPYRALFAGMPIGTSALSIQVNVNDYRIGLDGLMVAGGSRGDGRVTAFATGTILRTMLMPDHFSGTLEDSGVKTRVALGFANNTLAMVAVLPPPPGGSGRTRPPLSESRGLLDPLSAFVIPAARANLAPLSVCGRTQQVFSGLRRYDIHMFPSRIEQMVVAGQPISTLACWAELRTAATASRRPERWPPLTPRGQRAMIWLAPVGNGRLLAPVRIEAELRFGAFAVEATDAAAFGGASQRTAALARTKN